jgi:cobyrinic acid a,c-diamide synthase
VTPDEIEDFKEQLYILAKQIEETVDLNELLKIAKKAAPLMDSRSDTACNTRKAADEFSQNHIENGPMIFDISYNNRTNNTNNNANNTTNKKPKNLTKPLTIAVARDEAFCFYYEETLESLEQLGAEISFFSPCRDTHLPKETHALYLPGGYPELHAEALSSNHALRKEIHEKISDGLPCIAECGGFMYLHTFLRDKNGISYPMCGVIPETCFPKKGLGHFGYITLTAQTDSAFLKKGASIRGHEFHYWESTHDGTAFLAKKPSGEDSWECIHSNDTLLAGYPHFWFPSNPELLKNFTDAALQYQIRQEDFYAATWW